MPSTIEWEKQTNIFFNYDDIELKTKLNMPDASGEEIIKHLRDERDKAIIQEKLLPDDDFPE